MLAVAGLTAKPPLQVCWRGFWKTAAISGLSDRRCPGNFDVSATLGNSPFFVIEADEYDCAFFDKRSKFVHYSPRTLLLNNLEFDHADIFENLAAIEKQFHHLVRVVPGDGKIIAPAQDANLKQVLSMGCWSEEEYTGDNARWQAEKVTNDCGEFDVRYDGEISGRVTRDWWVSTICRTP